MFILQALAHKYSGQVLGDYGDNKGLECRPSCSKYPVFLEVFKRLHQQRRDLIVADISQIGVVGALSFLGGVGVALYVLTQ